VVQQRQGRDQPVDQAQLPRGDAARVVGLLLALEAIAPGAGGVHGAQRERREALALEQGSQRRLVVAAEVAAGLVHRAVQAALGRHLDDRAAAGGDAVARSCVEREAAILAAQAEAAMQRLSLRDPVPVRFHGGLIGSCDLYREAFLEGDYYLFVGLLMEESPLPIPAEGDYWWGMDQEPITLGSGQARVIDMEIELVPFEQ